jgi:plasmid stabilization system protein ParE
MSGLVFSSVAIRELEDILEYISRDNPRAAVDLVERIIGKCEILARFPNSGTLDEGLGTGIRMYSVDKYVIYFRTVGDHVRIESVRHGSRDASGLHFDS